MRNHDLPKPAVEPAIAVLRAVRPDQLDLPTPCADFTVRGLVAHLRQWAPVLGAAAGEPAPELSTLEEELTWMADAWSQPSAWEGTARMGGGDPLPATMIGGMALGEAVVHGWDLGRATGQTPTWDDEVLTFLLQEVERTAHLGRELEAYGPEVPVPATAPLLDRVLGLTGRDPRWTPLAA